MTDAQQRSTGSSFIEQRGFGTRTKTVAVARDSTFIHACIPAPINTRSHETDVTPLILDNRTTAMTGLQTHPGTPEPERQTNAIDIQSIVSAIRPDHMAHMARTPVYMDRTMNICFRGSPSLSYRGVCCMIDSGSEGETIQKIRTGTHRIYYEQDVLVAIVAVFVLMPVISTVIILSPLYGASLQLQSLIGVMIIDVCAVIPCIIVYFLKIKKPYAYLGLNRPQLVQSITTIDLLSHGHKCIQRVQGPTCPHEYENLQFFMHLGAGELLKRLKRRGLDLMSGQDVDTEKLTTTIIRNTEQTKYAFYFVGVFLLMFSAILLLGISFLYRLLGRVFLPDLFLISLVVLLIIGIAALSVCRHKLKTLKELEPESTDPISTLELDEAAHSNLVENLLALLRSSYHHPLRILVLETYGNLEYTGRTYYTVNCETEDIIELHEAILLPDRLYAQV